MRGAQPVLLEFGDTLFFEEFETIWLMWRDCNTKDLEVKTFETL